VVDLLIIELNTIYHNQMRNLVDNIFKKLSNDVTTELTSNDISSTINNQSNDVVATNLFLTSNVSKNKRKSLQLPNELNYDVSYKSIKSNLNNLYVNDVHTMNNRNNEYIGSGVMLSILNSNHIKLTDNSKKRSFNQSSCNDNIIANSNVSSNLFDSADNNQLLYETNINHVASKHSNQLDYNQSISANYPNSNSDIDNQTSMSYNNNCTSDDFCNSYNNQPTITTSTDHSSNSYDNFEVADTYNDDCTVMEFVFRNEYDNINTNNVSVMNNHCLSAGNIASTQDYDEINISSIQLQNNQNINSLITNDNEDNEDDLRFKEIIRENIMFEFPDFNSDEKYFHHDVLVENWDFLENHYFLSSHNIISTVPSTNISNNSRKINNLNIDSNENITDTYNSPVTNSLVIIPNLNETNSITNTAEYLDSFEINLEIFDDVSYDDLQKIINQ